MSRRIDSPAEQYRVKLVGFRAKEEVLQATLKD
jgi:hypothetical protein